MNLRDDLQLTYDWIPADSRVLDLGCGNGGLLAALVGHKECSGYGVRIDTDSVIEAMSHGVNVIQADSEQGLEEFGDSTLDAIVLSQTIQSMQNTEMILRGLIRVTKQTMVTFPNFGYWRNRFQTALDGHMPVSGRMPYHWYNTSNIHWCMLESFDLLCAKNNIRVLGRTIMAGDKRVRHLPNLLRSLAFYRVGQQSGRYG